MPSDAKGVDKKVKFWPTRRTSRVWVRIAQTPPFSSKWAKGKIRKLVKLESNVATGDGTNVAKAKGDEQGVNDVSDDDEWDDSWLS